ncbi:hypothetical protein SEA_SOOS_69 [Gordonia phage Soos]|nr:hypothetical protein SEA_SOOS_69 [Gordonia phage Soos]
MSSIDDEAPEFAAFILTHAKGRAHDELTNQLANLVQAVKETGKKGTLTLQIVVEPDKKVENVVRVEDKITTSIPKESRASMWYTDDEGKLHRDDPAQTAMWQTKGKTLVDNPDARTEPVHQREEG